MIKNKKNLVINIKVIMILIYHMKLSIDIKINNTKPIPASIKDALPKFPRVSLPLPNANTKIVIIPLLYLPINLF